MNENRRNNREPKKLYEDKIISIGKVTKVTQGGRNFRFSATVAVGDRKGRVGIGTGKSKEIPEQGTPGRTCSHQSTQKRVGKRYSICI